MFLSKWMFFIEIFGWFPPLGTLTFVIAIRDNVKDSEPSQNPMIHLKALFDYDPDEDLYIPCRELGICFSKGMICNNSN